MDLTITSVDYAPGDLDAQVPFSIQLLRKLPGPDRSDYWLAALKRPLTWLKDNHERSITHVILAARWEGTQIRAGVANLPVGIAYVTDPSVLTDTQLQLTKCEYVAIGVASDTTSGNQAPPLTSIVSGTIARLFGTGRSS